MRASSSARTPACPAGSSDRVFSDLKLRVCQLDIWRQLVCQMPHRHGAVHEIGSLVQRTPGRGPWTGWVPVIPGSRCFLRKGAVPQFDNSERSTLGDFGVYVSCPFSAT